MELSQLACSRDKLEEYFILHSSIDPDLLVQTFCGFNASLYLSEIMAQFDVSSLMDKVGY